MYNRYVPQPDGSFRRNQMPDPPGPSQRPSPPPGRPEAKPDSRPQPPCPDEPRPSPREGPPPCPQRRGRAPRQSLPVRPQSQREAAGVGSFLRQLLPKDFCTEDLLVVLLLLLMTGDCQEDQNSALLTLALYLFL